MARLQDTPLDELYKRVEAGTKAPTAAMLKAIWAKEDFTEYGDDYWNLVCKHPGKSQNKLPMVNEQADILFIQNHMPFPEYMSWGGVKRGSELDYMHRRQLESMVPGDISYTFTSLVKVAPEPFRDKNGKQTFKYTNTHMKPYWPYLLEEIERVQPKVIVSLNTEVTKLLGIKKANGGKGGGNRGEIHMSDLGIPVVLTMHPRSMNMIRQQASGGMWGDDYFAVVQRDIEKAAQLIRGDLVIQDIEEVIARVAEEQIHVCRSIEEVRHWHDIIMQLPPSVFTSWDLETTSLDPWSEDARILTSQVGWRRADGKIQAVVFPFWHRMNDFFDPDEAFEIHKEYLLRESAKVGHNLTFDIVFLAVTTGIRLVGDPIIDTLLALHSKDSGISGCYGLKTAVWDYIPDSGLGGYEELLQWDGEEPEWKVEF